MKPAYSAWWSLLSFSALCLVLGRPANTQQPGTPSPGISNSSVPNHRDSFDPAETSPVEQHKLEKVRQTERQRRIIADTNRLLALTADLKANMDKAPKDHPSGDLLKETIEIEKLARSIKDRMKG